MQGVLLWLIRLGLARVVVAQLRELVARMVRDGRISQDLALALGGLLAALEAGSKSFELFLSRPGQAPSGQFPSPASPDSLESPKIPPSRRSPPSEAR